MFSPVLQQIADQFYFKLEHNTPMPVEDYGWENYVWQSKKFAWAHLEKFYTDKVSVLHCVVMPHGVSNAPIFGYDVIEINGKLTGMFMDLTPVDKQTFPLPAITGTVRPVPDWGDFFSNNFICCVPTLADIQIGVTVFNYYVDLLPSTTSADFRPAQQRYINGQRKNPQTFRMLKSIIGEEKAHQFVNTVLFPDIV